MKKFKHVNQINLSCAKVYVKLREVVEMSKVCKHLQSISAKFQTTA